MEKLPQAIRQRAAEQVSEADKRIAGSQQLVLELRQLTAEDRDRLIFDCPPEAKRWRETRKA
jgi:hypothetical protein